MKKKIAVFFLFNLFIVLIFSETNRISSFFGIYGKRASFLGKINGSALEAWIYPYKVFQDYDFKIEINGVKKSIRKYLKEFHLNEEKLLRSYGEEGWNIVEEIYPSVDKPILYLIYKISLLKPAEIEISFKPKLSPMWPASLGGKFSFWDKRGFFVLSEAKWKNFAFIYFSESGDGIKLPAHKLPEGALKYKRKFTSGEHTFFISVFAKKGEYDKLLIQFDKLKKEHYSELKKRELYIKRFKNEHLKIKSNLHLLEKGIEKSIMRINSAFVINPYLGEGLIAGYGLSYESERPGFAWFFGGDGSINAMASLDYGDFKGARKEIEFLLKYQRDDGKIPHEISQGAEFVNWFKDYGFPYFHGDTTLYFITLIGEYVRRTGDIGLLKKHIKSIKKIERWMLNCDQNKNGIVEREIAGSGAAETGPLRRLKIKTDILLAGLSVRAWKELSFIFGALKLEGKKEFAEKMYKKAFKEFNKKFWSKNLNYYGYALTDKGIVKEKSSWLAVPMSFMVVEKEKGKVALKKLLSPELTTDWGVRFLSKSSKYYNPLSYNNGAVWPFLSGFASLASFLYGNPYEGFQLILKNLKIIKDFNYWYGEEVLSGKNYTPLNESVEDQIWTYGTTVSAFVKGLLGFRGNSLEKKVYLSPKIPLIIKKLDINNLKIGKGRLSLFYSFNNKNNEITYKIKFKNLEGYTIEFSPEVFSAFIKENQNTNNSFKVKNKNFIYKRKIALSHFWEPIFTKKLKFYDKSSSPIINLLDVKKEVINLQLWGKGKVEFKVLSNSEFECNYPVREDKTIKINFNKRWELKNVRCTFKKKNH